LCENLFELDDVLLEFSFIGLDTDEFLTERRLL